VSSKDKAERIVIQGAEGPEFNKVLNQTGEPFNVLQLENEIVAAARNIVERDSSVGAILLECTELPPAAFAVQKAVRLPVYDYTTMIKHIQDAAVRRPFVGYM
jgi:Asp/Glu/hydantoin racemase